MHDNLHPKPRMYRSIVRGIALAMLFQAGAFAVNPTVTDPNLQVNTVVTGLNQPTGMAFLGPNDFLILEKASGQVKRVMNGQVTGVVLDLPVNSNSERGLLGIALHPNFPADPSLYLYWTESSTGADSTVVPEVGNPASVYQPGTPMPLGNRVDRFLWNAQGQTLTYAQNIIRLHAFQHDSNNPANPNPAAAYAGNHNGGKIVFGPDGKLYIMIGDNGRRGWLQNLAGGAFIPTAPDDEFGGPEPDNNHVTGSIFRLNSDGSTPPDNPFFAAGASMGGEVGANIQKVFSYGHRNGFGLAFDPSSGRLWNSENGDDAFDEINQISAGGNYGWVQVMGPLSRVAQFKAIEMNLFTAPAVIGTLQQIRYPTSRIAYAGSLALFRMYMLPGATYHDPEMSWRYSIPPAGLGFLR